MPTIIEVGTGGSQGGRVSVGVGDVGVVYLGPFASGTLIDKVTVWATGLVGAEVVRVGLHSTNRGDFNSGVLVNGSGMSLIATPVVLSLWKKVTQETRFVGVAFTPGASAIVGNVYVATRPPLDPSFPTKPRRLSRGQGYYPQPGDAPESVASLDG